MEDKILKLFEGPLSIVNIGVDELLDHLSELNGEVLNVDWKPPSDDNLEILKKVLTANI